MFKPTDEWMDKFVRESNKIDPQPGHKNEPGDAHYDDHLGTLQMVIREANAGFASHYVDVHRALMSGLKGMEKEAGNLRTCDVRVGPRICPSHWDIRDLISEWDEATRSKICEKRARSTAQAEALVWRIHVDYEHIHPFVDGNGRSGRLLMVNHAIILGIQPWIVEYDKRHRYYARF